MDESEVQLLVKENFHGHGDQQYRIISENEIISSGSFGKVSRYLGRNEIFDINNVKNGYLGRGWRHATQEEVSSLITEAKLYAGFPVVN